jgi:hypothetical protein
MKAKKQITKNMTLGEIISLYPKVAEILVTDYNLHCVGCLRQHMSHWKTELRHMGWKRQRLQRW